MGGRYKFDTVDSNRIIQNWRDINTYSLAAPHSLSLSCCPSRAPSRRQRPRSRARRRQPHWAARGSTVAAAATAARRPSPQRPASECPRTALLPKIPHSNCCKIVPNRPLRGRRGRFGTLLQLLECGIFGRTAVCTLAAAQTTPNPGARQPDAPPNTETMILVEGRH